MLKKTKSKLSLGLGEECLTITGKMAHPNLMIAYVPSQLICPLSYEQHDMIVAIFVFLVSLDHIYIKYLIGK